MSFGPERYNRYLAMHWTERKNLTTQCTRLFKTSGLCAYKDGILLINTYGHKDGVKIAMVAPTLMSTNPVTIKYYSAARHQVVTKEFTDFNAKLIMEALNESDMPRP